MNELRAELRTILEAADLGDPVGYRHIRAEVTGPPCADGCLAPGSSPHYHPPITGYLLVGTAGTLELDADLNGVRVSSLYPLAIVDAD